ncbi:ABC transporter substrate-binding protein [Pseudonocardia alaniniphila]|uniref:ABC transporter substrate-binding protein n=1 Tax=Pseudonocardia alaniniphila TaxID=75291 RepID=A0ABS9TTU2_9PSEU|nr:ABC transporter substrate-binding protein [Pseudonocardia alaniniphila]MCH6171990.1 ABC transporter substrate-binding protein [Pseudonocardia alaniniphila]
MTAGRIGRRALLALGAAGAAGGVAGVADLVTAPRSTARGGTAGRSVRIGYLPITDASPLLVAHADGRFASAGLSVERPVLFRAWESLAQAFLAREIDVAHMLMPFAIQLRYALGAQLRVLAWNHTNGSALTVGPEVTALTDLAGRQVAIPFWWSIHNVLLQRMLRDAGLVPVVRRQPSAAGRTVGLVVMSPADMLPALDTGTIAGYVVADPFNAAAELRGVGRVLRFLGDVWRDHACCVVVVRRELVERSPATVRALTDSLVGAQLWIGGHRDETATLLTNGRYLPQPQPAVAKALDRSAAQYAGVLQEPTWHGERIGFAPYPFPTYTAALVAAMRETVVDGDTSFLDPLDPAAVHADLVDDRFVTASLAAAGGLAAFGLSPSLSRTEGLLP